MNKYIALLRGINVGGHNKIPMIDLRASLSEARLKNVQTYIQSGNVVFESSNSNIQELEQLVYSSIQSKFGFEIPVIIKTSKDLYRIFNDCPFDDEKKEASYFTILSDFPNEDLVSTASEKIYEGEEYKIINDCIYYYCERGYGRAKFNMKLFERKLNTSATSRNYKTMVKLLSLSSE